jgi:hypothetical protein
MASKQQPQAGPTTATSALAASVGGNYCEHAGFAYCPKCDRKQELVKAKRAAKIKLATLHFVGAIPGVGIGGHAAISPQPRDASAEQAVQDDDHELGSDSSDEEAMQAVEQKRMRQAQAAAEAAAQEAARRATEEATRKGEGDPCFRCCRRYTNLVRGLAGSTAVLPRAQKPSACGRASMCCLHASGERPLVAAAVVFLPICAGDLGWFGRPAS